MQRIRPLNNRRARRGNDTVRGALDAFRRIVQALRMDGRRAIGARLPSAQLFALQQIAEHPGVSINDLAALTFTHQSSVSVVVERLVRRRLVARITARDDRRRQSLVLRAEGRRRLKRAPVAVQEQLIAAITTLPQKDQRLLAALLATIAESLAPAAASRHPAMFFEERRSQLRQG